MVQEQLSDMSDEQIFRMCRKYGASALYWRQRFIGLLPEVNRRMLYEKKGFCSIFEFAKKLAGLSEDQVRITLNLERRFSDKPVLQELLVSGEVSINKLARVVSIATPENQEVLAQQVKLLPKNALETLVRDQKTVELQNSLQTPFFEGKSLPGQTCAATEKEELQLADDVKNELIELQQKGININGMLREFLDKRKLDIVQEKEKITAEVYDRQNFEQTRKPSRYIPVKIRNLLKKEFGEKCAISNCTRSKRNIHHADRFGLAGMHNPQYMVPLCKEHHIIAHSIDFQFHEMRNRKIRARR